MFWRSFCPVTFTAVGPWTSTRHEKRKKQLRIWLELLEKRKKRQLTNSWKCQIIHELFSFKCQHQFDTCTATQKFQLCTQDDNSVAAAPQKYHQCGLTPSTLANSVKYFFFFICFNYWEKNANRKKKERKKKLFSFHGHRCLIFLENLVGCKGVQLAIDEFQTFHLILRHLIRLEVAFTTQ